MMVSLTVRRHIDLSFSSSHSSSYPRHVKRRTTYGEFAPSTCRPARPLTNSRNPSALSPHGTRARAGSLPRTLTSRAKHNQGRIAFNSLRPASGHRNAATDVDVPLHRSTMAALHPLSVGVGVGRTWSAERDGVPHTASVQWPIRQKLPQMEEADACRRSSCQLWSVQRTVIEGT
ncbi:hypothetical protein PYCCODRAFT_1438600 [Trametes coccinea BRFM310]|uniref:Uncharacterized protein n=1 Tax=Trametes coccinea (strain BRFM310) TaxID=1353009 RepID=A0A1Y2IDJ2_TRAC3|nr:hypothetical protein PYCCODRAFT_1438600 [Trametes coccinea BRFM310]